MQSPIAYGSPQHNISRSPLLGNPDLAVINDSKPKHRSIFADTKTNSLSTLSYKARVRDETRQMLSFAWPVTIATVARVGMYSIDTAFLGHLGNAQLAGSAMASLVANLVSTFLYAPAYGLNSLCSQAIGAGNPKLAGNWLQLSVAVSAVMLIPSFSILFFVDSIVSPVQHNESVLHYASIFGRYSCCFLVPTFLYMAIRQYFQALQIVHPATIVSVVSVAVNVVLNQLMIYGVDYKWKMFGNHVHIQFDGLGFKGSPLATTCSLSFQLGLFCLYAVWYKRYPTKAGAWGGFECSSFAKDRIINFFKVIGPMMIGDATENWSYQAVVLICGALPDAALAANTVIFTLWGVLWSVFWGIGLATIVRSGKTISNGDITGIKLVIRISMALSIVCNGIIAAICFFLRTEIAKLFTSSDDVIEILEHSIPVLAALFFVGGLGWSACSAMEGMSRNTERSLVYCVTAWLMFVPGALYLALYSPWCDTHPWSPIVLIWGWGLVVEVIRCILIWIILLRTDWDKQVFLAKERSEAAGKKPDDDDDEDGEVITNIKTSPKTRALIGDIDGDEDEDSEERARRRRTACSLHEIPDEQDRAYHPLN